MEVAYLEAELRLSLVTAHQHGAQVRVGINVEVTAYKNGSVLEIDIRATRSAPHNKTDRRRFKADFVAPVRLMGKSCGHRRIKHN